MRNQKAPHEKFGTLLGIAPGDVRVYSSDYDSMEEDSCKTRDSLRNYVDGTFTGYKWQCVELARRWMYMTKGYIFDDIPMAYDIFSLTSVKNPKTGENYPLKSFKNGSKRHPEPGCLLIWKDGGDFEITGHVAIITEVTPNYVRIVEQNVDQHIWGEGKNYSRELKTKIDRYGGYWIACDKLATDILGWVIQTDDSTYSEVSKKPGQHLFNIKSARLNFKSYEEKGWLNIANADESAYVDVNGYALASDPKDRNLYYYISNTALEEIKRASNELHSMFMHATHLVLKDDNLLSKFHIPENIWYKIHRSWENRKNQLITGRFDFCLTEQGVKLYEYNADTSACYIEAAKLQGKWAEHYECRFGLDPGAKLQARLIETWKNSEVDDLLHVLTDTSDPEEIYHSLFMKSMIENAGIRVRLIDDYSVLRYNDAGDLLDGHGDKIKWIWKTWAWETALAQIRQNNESLLKNNQKTITNIAEILLDDNTMIYEPLWTVVTSNKAILPVLWDLYPNHPYLLNSRFDINDDLRKSGYVTKPIAGRSGANIEIFDMGNKSVNSTTGKFDYQNQIYQELCRLPIVAGYHTQISAFTVGGSYAGACLRADENPVITHHSDILPLRVVYDSLFY